MKLEKNIIELNPVFILESEGTFFVCLEEFETQKEILIEIGDAEATNLFLNMNYDLFPTERPDTYDLMINSLLKFGIQITECIVIDYDDDTWFGQIELINLETKEVSYLDARPSDLLNICLKLDIPFLIYEDLLYKKNDSKLKEISKPIDYSIIKLEELLNEYVLQEEYEKASEVKKLIEEKKKKRKP